MEPDGLRERELDLRDYLRILRRRKITILLTVVVVVGVTVALTQLETPVYEATTKVLMRPSGSPQVFASEGGGGAPEQRLDDEIEIIQGQAVRDAVREELGRVPGISVSQVGDTSAVTIKVRDTDARAARDGANTYADVYLEVRHGQVVDELLAAREEIQRKLDELSQGLAALDAAVRAAPLEDQGLVLDDQAAQRATISQQQGFYGQELDRLEVATNLSEEGGSQVLLEATVPGSPATPQPVRNALVALAVGLILGVGLALLREYLDDTVKSKDDLERASDGLTVIGLIPKVAGWKDRKTPYLVTTQQPRSPAAEAYRTLRTSLQFAGLETSMRSLQVTSATAGEGKTTTLANLAVAFARAGQTIVLVDLDLRRPRMHEFFGLGNDVGFTSVLLGDVPLSEAAQAIPDETGLEVLTSGPPPPDPAEVLPSRRVAEVVETLAARWDLVLIDSPPVVPVTDPLVIAGLVDATLLVVDSGSSRKKGVHRAVELLRHVEAPIVGAVLNEVDLKAGYMADYGAAYGYRRGYYRRDDPAKPAAQNGAKRRRKGRRKGEAASEAAAERP